MNQEKRDLWLDSVQGRNGDADPAMMREAAILRRLLAARAAGTQAPKVRKAGFIARLHNEKILDQPSYFRWPVALAAMLMLAIGLGIWLPHEQPDEMPVSRGDEAIPVLRIANPQALADRIEQRLLQDKLLVRRTAELGAIRLQARIPAESTVLRADLAVLGMSVPAHGRLDVLIAPVAGQ